MQVKHGDGLSTAAHERHRSLGNGPYHWQRCRTPTAVQDKKHIDSLGDGRKRIGNVQDTLQLYLAQDALRPGVVSKFRDGFTTLLHHLELCPNSLRPPWFTASLPEDCPSSPQAFPRIALLNRIATVFAAIPAMLGDSSPLFLFGLVAHDPLLISVALGATLPLLPDSRARRRHRPKSPRYRRS